jgi:hypothetical protein
MVPRGIGRADFQVRRVVVNLLKMIRYNLSSPRTKFEILLNDACVRNAGRSLERIWQISDIGPLSARHVLDQLFAKYGHAATSREIGPARDALGKAIMDLAEISAATVGTDKMRP